MEHRFDGLGLSNQHAMINEDKISELPNALLLQILSSLPTENAIATSVLSKRWRSLWKMLPKLKFDQIFDNIDPHRFSENVYKTLTLHNSLVLESLHLKFNGKTDCSDVGVWIATAFARRVRKLVLDCIYDDDDDDEEHTVTLRSVVFSYNDTLEILKLKSAFNFEFPSRVCLKSLRKLYLYRVQFNDEESVSNLLCGCPSLEDLVVHKKTYIGTGTFTIAVPSLQRLTIKALSPEDKDGCYMINAPALKYLDIGGFNFFGLCQIEKAPERLVEAKISDVSSMVGDNILESLTSAKRLFLHFSPLDIRVRTGNIYDQLVCLELHTHETEWWNLLSIMLDSSPKLKILMLTNLYLRNDDRFEEYWDPPKRDSECFMFNLETLVWKGYEWQRGDKEVITCILESARQLKKATFSMKRVDPENPETLEKRRKILNELASVGRA